MSEENKEVEQIESKAVKDAEQTECEADKEATQIETKEEQTENSADKEENEAGKEAGQMEIETEADQETDQAEAEEIETKDQPEVAATAAAIPSDVFVDKSVYEQIDKRKKGKKIAAIISISVGGVILLCYLTLSIWFSFHFNKNTYIDGQNVSYHTVKSVKNTIDTYMSGYTLSVNGREHASFVIRPEDIDLVKPEDGIIRGVVTHVIFKGVHYEMEVMANNYEWLVHSTDMFPVGAEVGLRVDPFDIQIMKKPESEDEEAVPIEE